jgi:hypothetical protein
MSDEFITGGEFGRWRQDFQSFQERLDERLDRGFGGLNNRLDELNGRTRKNSEAIVSLDTRVENIRTSGCQNLKAHQTTLAKIGPPQQRWHSDKRLWFGSAAGASVIALLYEVAQAVHAYFTKGTP